MAVLGPDDWLPLTFSHATSVAHSSDMSIALSAAPAPNEFNAWLGQSAQAQVGAVRTYDQMQQPVQQQGYDQVLQGGYGGYGGGYMQPMMEQAPPKPEIVLPELPICPFEVKKLRVPEIKLMLTQRGIMMEMMQGVLKKDLLEMLLEKLEDEGALKEDPPEKKPRVYIEDDVANDSPDDGALDEESDEEHYDPESDVSGGEQSDDDTIWADDI